MIKILFICLGNICRSPMAEYIMKDMVADPIKYGIDRETTARIKNMDFHIESAATSTEEIGNDIYPPAKAKLREKGIAFDRRRARKMTIKEYQEYDYIVYMEDSNLRGILSITGDGAKAYKLLEFAGIDRGIADPWYTGDFELTYNDIVTGCKALLKKLSE